MSLIEKLHFLCTIDENLRCFLEISHDLNKDPWCADADVHSHNDLCGGACEKIKFLIPIMEDMRKNDISNEQKRAFLYFNLYNSFSFLNSYLMFIL